MNAYKTPFKLIEHCEPDLDEKSLSRFVYSGRVRLEKSPGVPCTAEELKAWGYETRVAAGISAVDGDQC